MKLPSFLLRKQAPSEETTSIQDPDQIQETPLSLDNTTDLTTKTDTDEEHEIGIGSKVKVIAALLVVGLAAYIAFWVQEPSSMKVDVLSEEATVADASTDSENVEDQQFPTLVEVSITEFSFSPANLTVEGGTTVVWTNLDPVAHTVTSESFSSESMNSGDSFSYEFNKAGIYEYSCSFHPQMKGVITVTSAVEAEEPAAGSEEHTAATGENDSGSLEIAAGYFSSLEDDYASVGAAPISAAVTGQEEEEATSTEPAIITFDAEELLAEGDAMHEAARIAEGSDKLATTGPEDILYFAMFGMILYLNRKKIAGAFNKA